MSETNSFTQNEEAIETNEKKEMPPFHYLSFLIAFLLKPFQTFKENDSQLKNTKTSLILSVISVIGLAFVNIIRTIITTIHVASFDYKKGYTYIWKWENLKNIKWLEIIFQNLLIFVGVVLVIAVVFYIMSLIFKKNISFVKTLSISAISMLPILLSMFLATFAGFIWNPLNIGITLIGCVYSIIILYELINSEVSLEKDYKIYFNTICFGILIVLGYYFFMKFFIGSAIASSLPSSANDFLNNFK